MKSLSTVRLTIISLLLFSAQVALALPKAFQADYVVSKGSMELGSLSASLKYNGNQYHYHKYTKATGIAKLFSGIKIIENADGQFSGQVIKPLNYLFNQSKRRKSRIDKVQFNGTRAIGSYKGQAFNLAIPSKTLDRASLELALARDLSLNKSPLVYSVIEKGRIKNYTLSKLGEEKINTPAGTFNTLKVSVVRSSRKRHTTFWLAKELDYIPVKIHHKEKGKLISTVIKNYNRM